MESKGNLFSQHSDDFKNFELKNHELSQTDNSLERSSKNILSIIIQQQINNWFLSKNIQLGNPQDIIDKHRSSRREQINEKINLEQVEALNLKGKSGSNLASKRKIRSLSIVL